MLHGNHLKIISWYQSYEKLTLTYVQQVGKLKVPFACLKELHLIWNNMNIITVRTYFRISVVMCVTIFLSSSSSYLYPKKETNTSYTSYTEVLCLLDCHSFCLQFIVLLLLKSMH
jgi:hypothetical protein